MSSQVTVIFVRFPGHVHPAKSVAVAASGYARTWRTLWAAVLVLGVGLALLETPRGIAPVAFTLFWCLGVAIRVLEVPVPVRPRPMSMAFVATGALGYLAFSRPGTTLLALVALLTAPVVVRFAAAAVRRERDDVRRRRAYAVAVVADAPTEPALSLVVTDSDVDEPPPGLRLTTQETEGPLLGLSDRELCRLWRQSLWQLRRPLPDHAALRTVLLRQACLDELSRRHGAEVQAWLDSGARASSGPDRFLEPPQAS